MSVLQARPDVSELAFRFFDRSIHPELFDSCRAWSTVMPNYRAEVKLGRMGHLVSVRHGRGTVTELACPLDRSLPAFRRRLEKRIRGCRNTSVELAESGVRFQAGYELERLDPTMYLRLHEEMQLDCQRAEVAAEFGSSSRLAPPAVSLVRVDPQHSHLLVHAFHTFPENCAVVKTQSLLEL